MSVYDDTTRSRPHDEIGTGAPPPPEITERFRDPKRRLALTVPCGFCGARVGAVCTFRGSTRLLSVGYHLTRLERAEAQQSQPAGPDRTPIGSTPSNVAAGTLR